MGSWRRWAFGVMTFAVLTQPAAAQQPRSEKALSISAENLTAGERDTHDLPAGSDANTVYPGDVIRYRLVFTNVTDVPVRSIEFTDPIPKSLVFVLGSSASDGDDVLIDYSIDGGATFAERPTVQRLINGERLVVPAPPERYTHVRWRIEDWVQPGAQVTAEFRATLPDNRDRESASKSPGRDG